MFTRKKVLFDYFSNLHSDLIPITEEAKFKKNQYENIPLIPKYKCITSSFKNSKLLQNNKLQKDFLFFNEDGGTNADDDNWSSILSNHDVNLAGDRVMRRMQYALDNVPGYKRHEYQIQFHQEISMALLPKIYQTEWSAYSSLILQKYGIKKYRPERFGIMPRRFGKTEACVRYAVSAIYTIPNITIGIFSTGKRTAGKFQNQILKALRQMPNFSQLKGKCNNEEIELIFAPNDIRVINSYPGTVDVCS